MIPLVGGETPPRWLNQGGFSMTLTIADRWSVTFRVQSLARVTMPPRPVAAPVARHTPDANEVVQMERVQHDLAAERARWETEAYFCGSRRMF
jgi:hypothetical protein